jgi:hypothetical protein
MRHKACLSRNFQVKYQFSDVRYISLTFSYKREEINMQLSTKESSNENGSTAISISNLNLQTGFVQIAGDCLDTLNKTEIHISFKIF